MRIFFGLFTLAAFLLIPALTTAMGVEVAVGGWSQSPSGSLSYKSLGVEDELDLEEQANYDDEFRLQGRVKIDMPLFLPNIYLMATPMKFEGAGIKIEDFSFGDIDFNADIPFYSKLELTHYDVALYYSIPLLETATLNTLNLEFGLDFRYIELKAEIDQPETMLSESTSESIVLPMIYVGGQLTPVEWFAFEVEGRGIAYSSNHYYDFIARFKAKPFGPLFVAVGWRHEEIEVDQSDIEASVTVSGPFAEAGFAF